MMVREGTVGTCLSHVLLPPTSCPLPPARWCPQFYLYIVSTGGKFQHCWGLLDACKLFPDSLRVRAATRHTARQSGWALSDTVRQKIRFNQFEYFDYLE